MYKQTHVNGKPLAGLRLVDELELHDDALHLLVTDVDLERVQHRRSVVVGIRGGELRRDHGPFLNPFGLERRVLHAVRE